MEKEPISINNKEQEAELNITEILNIFSDYLNPEEIEYLKEDDDLGSFLSNLCTILLDKGVEVFDLLEENGIIVKD